MKFLIPNHLTRLIPPKTRQVAMADTVVVMAVTVVGMKAEVMADTAVGMKVVKMAVTAVGMKVEEMAVTVVGMKVVEMATAVGTKVVEMATAVVGVETGHRFDVLFQRVELVLLAEHY